MVLEFSQDFFHVSIKIYNSILNVQNIYIIVIKWELKLIENFIRIRLIRIRICRTSTKFYQNIYYRLHARARSWRWYRTGWGSEEPSVGSSQALSYIQLETLQMFSLSYIKINFIFGQLNNSFIKLSVKRFRNITFVWHEQYIE